MRTIVAWTVWAASSAAQSLSPEVSAVRVDAQDRHCVTLDVRWPNSWRNDRNHDAAWLVLRGEASGGLLAVSEDGHHAEAADGARAEIVRADDGAGVFVSPAAAHRGDVSWTLTLRLAEAAPAQVSCWAVGMVFVPAGGFELGDTDPLSRRFGGFYQVGTEEPGTVFPVRDEAAITVADEPGALWYATDRNRYRGDQGGPIPAGYPKGTRAFYVMKHELTQGEYARWLSALPRAWQDVHAPEALEGEEIGTCSIRRDGERFVASAPDRPCNFVTWADSAAWFDWHGLRPMTEFEFEKASRGPRRPEPRDFPWGTAHDAKLRRTVLEHRDLAHAGADDEAGLTDATKAEHGASFYWVMDLSGSLWERVVSAGHESGRAFRGSHGDGQLSEEGEATNADWPRMEGRDAPGVGYRGGAQYFGPRVADNPTNPHSPVAFRTYAGWGGAYRYKTYSARGVRTAPQ